MLSRRVRILLGKEWAELRKRRGVLLSSLLVPLLLMTIAFALAVAMPMLVGEQAYSDPDLKFMLGLMRRQSPSLADLQPAQLFQVLIFRQFLLFLLIVPVMIGISIATYSIVGEKINRSLEPLLATPITTSELLWGKSLAAAIPATLVVWFYFALYGVGIVLFTSAEVFRQVINPAALLIMLLMAPAIGVLGLSLGILTSSRSSDPRSAQQIGVVVILPLVALVITQLRGIFLLTPGIVLVASLVLVVMDAMVLRLGTRIFQRETILTQWK